MSNLIEIPYHAFYHFRDEDDSINELVKVLSSAIGVKVNSVRFNIIH
jgi:transposase